MWVAWAITEDGVKKRANLTYRNKVPTSSLALEAVQQAYKQEPPSSIRFLKTEKDLSEKLSGLPVSDAITV